MSEVATQPGTTTSPEPGSVPATGGEPTPATAPAGYVPQSEAEAAREEARRARQAAEDLRRELATAKAGTKPEPGATEGSGFDLDAFRTSLLRDVSSVLTLSQTATSIKSEFPHADPSLFEADRMSQFSSPEAYRQAVEDSHRRVAAILDSGWAEREQKLRDELAAKFGDTGAAGVGGNVPAGGDPTVAQLNAMSDSEIDALKAKDPDIVNRVLRKAMAGA